MPPLRVTFVQPALPKYRVPVFRELAGRPGIDFRLYYGKDRGITNVEPDGFRGEYRKMHQWGPGRQDVRWQQAQLTAAGDPEVDVLCLSWGTRYLSLPLAMRRARRRGLPVILWGHGYSKAESRLKRMLRDQIGGLATALLFYDEATAQRAVDDGFRPEQVFAAPNAIDQTTIGAARDAWLADDPRLAKFREANHLGGKRLLLYISRMTPENRLDLLVEAVAKLAPNRPELLVALVGNGAAEKAKLEALAEERGVADRLRFLGAIYDEEQLAPWCLASDLFVYPANIGLSLLHAFGYGLPVITSSNLAAQNPEIVALEDGKNGLLYEADSAAALAESIDRLLADDTLRAQMGAAARQTVEQRFNVPTMVDGMVSAIEYCHAQRKG
ncbi:MAG: glycosyltransferase family 4 protein [Planctomycetota bacterium]